MVKDMDMLKVKERLDSLDMENVSSEQLNNIINTLSGKEMEQEINKRQQKIDEANTIRIQSETKIASYRESYSEIMKELQSMGVDPKNINNELMNLCKEIVDLTVEIDANMPDIESIKNILKSGNTQNNDVAF
jgi:uncharacterized coiled-coil DUF342 family protein